MGGSQPFKIDWDDLKVTLWIAAAGAAGTALTILSEWVNGQDFGDVTPIVTAGWSVLSAFLWRLIRNNSQVG